VHIRAGERGVWGDDARRGAMKKGARGRRSGRGERCERGSGLSRAAAGGASVHKYDDLYKSLQYI
jgi:hypothetical protein